MRKKSPYSAWTVDFQCGKRALAPPELWILSGEMSFYPAWTVNFRCGKRALISPELWVLSLGNELLSYLNSGFSMRKKGHISTWVVDFQYGKRAQTPPEFWIFSGGMSIISGIIGFEHATEPYSRYPDHTNDKKSNSRP